MKKRKLLLITLILTLVFCSTALAKTKSKNNKNKPKSQVVASGVDAVNNSNSSGGLSTIYNTTSTGQWVENGGKWFYMTSDGTFAKDTWLWLDEDHDTIAKLYHFDANGVMSQSTTVPLGSGEGAYIVNIDSSGAAIDCTQILNGQITYYETFNDYRLPVGYSINGDYSYSLYVDHYNFEEINSAFIEPIKKSGDYYSADVSLFVNCTDYGSDLDTLRCFITTTAKFSPNCKVRFRGKKDVISISDFYRMKKEGSYNCIDVYSVDANGYITDCTIHSAG